MHEIVYIKAKVSKQGVESTYKPYLIRHLTLPVLSLHVLITNRDYMCSATSIFIDFLSLTGMSGFTPILPNHTSLSLQVLPVLINLDFSNPNTEIKEDSILSSC